MLWQFIAAQYSPPLFFLLFVAIFVVYYLELSLLYSLRAIFVFIPDHAHDIHMVALTICEQLY